RELLVVWRPRLPERCRLLHDVEAAVAHEPGMYPVSVNLRQARTDPESSFYTSLAFLLGSRRQHPPRATLEDDIDRTRDFQNFLDACVNTVDGHLVLLID